MWLLNKSDELRWLSDKDMTMQLFNRKYFLSFFFTLALFASASLLLSSCGFRLRGAITLPESLTSIAIEGTSEHSDLGRVLYRSLKRGGVTIVPTAEAALRLQILKDEVQRRVLSVDATGKANEYELKHLLRYAAIDSKGEALVLDQDITTVRAYQFDPNSILAKGDEEQKLRKAIILSSAQQMLRQLSAAMRRHAAQQTDVDKVEAKPATSESPETTPVTK